MKSSGIGGQAVIEGIMMRNGEKISVAVRKPDGEVEVTLKEHRSFIDRHPGWNIPFLRGVFQFVDSLIVGMDILSYSASFYEEEEEREKEKTGAEKKKESVLMGFTMVLSVILALGIFVALPLFLAGFFRPFIQSKALMGFLEGVIRLVIFVLYICLISLMKDIRRVFMYHGAEHKCINCVEHGLDLTVENVRKSSRQHKRCGTSFLLFVIVIGILVSMVIQTDVVWMRIVFRILLIPVIAGISYEILKLAGRSENPIVNLISKPGLWLQGLTTREPDDSMIEVGIRSVEKVFDWKKFERETFGKEQFESDADVKEQTDESKENE